MAMIYNASEEHQHVKVFGKHFSFAPKQIKLMDDTVGHFIATERRYLGFVSLPVDFEDPSFQTTPQGRSILESKTAEGINARVAELKRIIYNNQVSLKQDLEKANIKADPRTFASDGEIKAMETLVKYQNREKDAEQKKLDRIKELEKQLEE